MNTEGKPLSKEEILNKRDLIFYCASGDDVEGTLMQVSDAMDEYAEIEAIGFAEFIRECDYTHSDVHYHIDRNPHGIKSGYYTTAQLYQLYKKQQP
jgi:hypothetical protein